MVNVYDKKHCELYANNERGYVLFSGNKEENMHPSCNLSLFYMGYKQVHLKLNLLQEWEMEVQHSKCGIIN
jgi:hypothetical protein